MNTKTMVHFEKEAHIARAYARCLEQCGFIVKEFIYCEEVGAYRIIYYDPE